jgi:DNA-binding CsgD family transcriptional regulator/tetratricopeptide (TPR) repeat protein
MPRQVLCPVVVGRDEEMRALNEALDAAIGGQGGCALLMGEPGIGKSRLAREVMGRAAAREILVASGRAVPASATAAYRPLTEALLQVLRHRPGLNAQALTPWLPALQPIVPGLAGHEPPPGEVPSAMRAEAVLQLLRHAAPEGAVIVLEDLHWADPDTVGLLEHLVDNLGGERLFLVVTLRDNQLSPALELARRQRSKPGVTYIALDRLGDDSMATMVRACRPGTGADELARIRATAEGIPLLVEDLLASPGLPETFAETVRARLGELGDDHRAVIEAAAVLGRNFDWEYLAAVTGQSEAAVADALARGVESLLLIGQGTAVVFRHALTREAVLDAMLPPRHRELGTAALEALAVAHPEPDGESRELAVDLAIRAGDLHRAGRWLVAAGRQDLDRGALATAADTLRRAADLLAGAAEQAQAELGLIEALALAGRVEEAAATGARVIRRTAADPGTADFRVEVHRSLAQAAVAASRWQMARYHLGGAYTLLGEEPDPVTAARLAVLEADVMMADGDYDSARTVAEGALSTEGVPPEVSCHALEIVGRIHRSRQLSEARSAFERALVIAEASDLPLWRLRALHEMGTVDLFDHAGVDRLFEARRAAEQMGAVGTVAVLDLQLSAGFTCRWDLDACDLHARSAIDLAERLGLEQVRAKALAMLTGSAGMRADLTETERLATLTVSAAPEDPMLEGFSWGMRGTALLLSGDVEGSLEPYARGMALLGRLPHAEPAALRALWPLVLASLGYRTTREAIDEAHRLGVGAFGLNRGLLGYAEAVLAARQGQEDRARGCLAEADREFTNCGAWVDLARFMAAPIGLERAWREVGGWLIDAADGFDHRGLGVLAGMARDLLRQASPNPWSEAGVSAREAGVLRLVLEGLANKEIAARLHISPRTVEKHVESLLRKTGARSRTELVALVGASPGPAGRPAGLPPTT